MIDVWAAVPVKAFTGAKQRTASVLSPLQREQLAAVMVEDVLDALAGATRWRRRWPSAMAPGW